MTSKIDFINGDIRKSLVKMFIPLFLAMTLTMIYSMVDSLWVGNLLGGDGMSALTAGTAIVLIMNSLSMGMGNGVAVMISQMVGANDKENIPGATATIITISIALSVMGCVIAEMLIDPILSIIGTPETILKAAALYLKIYLLGNVALFIYMQFTSIFRAFGDPVFQMKGMLLTAVFNAIADPFMIKLWGLSGAAIATVISEILCLVYAIGYYKKRKMFVFNFHKMSMRYVRTMMSLSIPTTIQGIMPALSSAVMISFITPFGLTAMAGYGVARNLELIMFMPTNAMCMAITSIVGQCKGARRMDRAKAYLREGAMIGGTLIAVFSVTVIVFSGKLTGLFGQDNEVALVVTEFFKILSIGYVLYMITSCLQGYVTGIGKTGMSMMILIVYYLVIRIPAAVILQKQMGLIGIWTAFLVSHCVTIFIAYFAYYIYSKRVMVSV